MRRRLLRVVVGGVVAVVLAAGLLGVRLPVRVESDSGPVMTCPEGTHPIDWLWPLIACWPDSD